MSEPKPNPQYNLAGSASLAIRVANHQRRVMYERFLRDSQVRPNNTILDVGVTSDRAYASSNYLEAWYPNKAAITAAGIDDASFLEGMYPGVRFVHANALDLPFADRSFDFVHSSAVLEHVGSQRNQMRFAKECARVARRSFFLTTPNRWFPVEVHTSLPLLHWLPKPTFRWILGRTRLGFFADEANLNLVSACDLKTIATGIANFDVRVIRVRLATWTSNLILVGSRIPIGDSS